MRTIDYICNKVIPAALSMLPAKMDTREARAMLLAIGLQESAFQYRAQVGGPALGFWEFEGGGGFKGVCNHPETAPIAADLLLTMGYGTPDPTDFEAIRNNDILACAFARLLLWTGKAPLAGRDEAGTAWNQYQQIWRPGKPHPDAWKPNYNEAWRTISAYYTGAPA